MRTVAGTSGPVNTYDRPRLEFFTGYSGDTLGMLPFASRRGLPNVRFAGLTGDQQSALSTRVARAIEAGRLLTVGRSFHTRRQFAEAREVYRAVAQAFPGHPAARFLLAALADQVRDAIAERTRALEFVATDGDVLFELATLYEQLDQPAAAEEYYRQALHAAPDDERAYLNLGQLQARRGRVRQASALFAQALQRNPRSVHASYNLALARHLAGDRGGATAALKRAQHALAGSAQPEPWARAQIHALAHKLNAGEAAHPVP